MPRLLRRRAGVRAGHLVIGTRAPRGVQRSVSNNQKMPALEAGHKKGVHPGQLSDGPAPNRQHETAAAAWSWKDEAAAVAVDGVRRGAARRGPGKEAWGCSRALGRGPRDVRPV